VPDGVGGALKRKANDLVLHGKDIMSAESFVENCKDSSVFVYEVGQKAIDYKTLIQVQLASLYNISPYLEYLI
jgi:hypothetical protein